MAISNYTELQAAVANYLARDDLTLRIPEFVTLCEAKLNRELFVRQMEERSTVTVDTAADEPEFITLPDDFQSMRRLRLSSVTGKPRLQYLSGAQADEKRYGGSDVAQQPAYFTIVGDEMELIPTPDSAYEIEMVYRKTIPPLADNTTNWLLTLAPDAYLYGTLLEAMPYTKDDERIQVWLAGFSAAIDGLNRLSLTSTFNAGPMAVRASGITP
jgi:hypothetical protein